MSEVSCLACLTAPALLLAGALYRWWPGSDRPAIVDLGPHILLHPSSPLPGIPSSGKILIVQDLVDRLLHTNQLVHHLRNQGKEVLGVAALVALADESGQAAIDVPIVAVVARQRPAPPDSQGKPVPEGWWIEPRTLRPIRLSTLRRHFRPKVDSRRAQISFSSSEHRPYIRSGHYAYGGRHYEVAVDVKAAFETPLAEKIAVAAVLMPLHSQIHYLWPKIERILAQNDKRVPVWYMDATLFLGHGPAYHIPWPFEKGMEDLGRKMLECLKATHLTMPPPMHLLILDDAMVSGRTVETILASIDRGLAKVATRLMLPENLRLANAITYCTVFNQMGAAKTNHWQGLDSVGREYRVNFSFHPFEQILGLPTYDNDECPLCTESRRITRLREAAASRHFAAPVAKWAEGLLEKSALVALDIGPGVNSADTALCRTIVALETPQKDPEIAAETVEMALLRFHELVYYSYPPTDVIEALKRSMPSPAEPDLRAEYRWGVIHWCVRNYARLTSFCGLQPLLDHLTLEIQAKTSLVERAFHSLSHITHLEAVRDFVLKCIEWLEAETAKNQRDEGLIVVLERSICIVLLNAKESDYSERWGADGITLHSALEGAASRSRAHECSAAKNLFLHFRRPRSWVPPHYSLHIIAEQLFRGRRSDKIADSGHDLIPKLLDDVLDKKAADYSPLTLRLLEGSLALFLAALRDLEPYYPESGLRSSEIKEWIEPILSWLAKRTTQNWEIPPDEAKYLRLALDPQKAFWLQFNAAFHTELANLKQSLETKAKQAIALNKHFVFEFGIDDSAKNASVLTHIGRLQSFLENWGIDFAKLQKLLIAADAAPALRYRESLPNLALQESCLGS
jgi:hypothetical protein